jgi:hypothetical protein
MNPTWNKEELPEQGKESINVRIYKKGDKTGFSTYRGISLLLSTYKNCVLHPAVKANSICRGKYVVSSLWIST